MQKRIMITGALWGLILLGICSHSLTLAEGNPDGSALVVKGNNTFTWELYNSLAKSDDNIFFSPYSISSALAMTYAGARGQTAEQMMKTLHFDLAGDQLHPRIYALMKELNPPGKGYELSVANALWAQKNLELLPDYLQTTKAYYEAGLKEVDYAHETEKARQTINKWAEDKTNNKIIELIKEDVLEPLTRLVLTNAIYFKGEWMSPFKPENTFEAPFYMSARDKANIRLMHQTGKFKYMENERLQMLELPYRDSDLVMNILLPAPGTDIKDFGSMLQPESIQACLGNLIPQKVEVFLPQFKLEQGLELSENLKGLGMIDAFDENAANFSGISPTFLYITKVIHKAYVEVNEEGTEAAAATAVIMGTKSAGFNQAVFRADRPFAFLIRDTKSGCILFVGRLMKPNS